MSTVADREWQDWAASWREDAPAARSEALIRDLVTRQTRRLRIALAAEVAVTILVMAPVLWMVAVERTGVAIAFGVAAATHSAILWAFTLWNRAGLWRPLSHAVGDYLAVARARCDSEVRGARFAFWMVTGECAAVGVWLLVRRSPDGGGPNWWWIPPAGVTAAVIGWSVWFGRRAKRQAERLQLLAAQLED